MTITGDPGSFRYLYDAVGREVELDTPNTESAAWAYLSNGWLQSQILNGLGQFSSNYSYNARGLLTHSDFGLLNSNGGTSYLYQYANMTYDGVGNRISSTLTSYQSAAQTTYSYDNKNQILQEQSQRDGGYTNNFAYDGGNNGPGNATTLRGGVQAFNTDNQLSGSGYGWDGNGNPTTYKGNALTFDPENRLTAYGTAQTDAYSGDGLRAWKQNSAGRTYFVYDGEQPVVTLSATGATVTENMFGPNGLVGRLGSVNFAYGFDPQGNTAKSLREDGTPHNGGTFDAFGKNRSSGTPGDYVGFGAQWGGFTDSETGLVLFTHRFYDPSNGRWLTRDPIGYAGGINLYGYVGNDPVDGSDPLGYMELSGAIPIGSGLGFGGVGVAAAATSDAVVAVAVVAAPVVFVVGIGAAGVYGGSKLGNEWADSIEGQDGLPASQSNAVLGHKPSDSPGPDWEWRGGPKGGWFNPKTGESAHPDLEHLPPIGGHWDYKPNRRAEKIRIPPGGNPECLGPGY